MQWICQFYSQNVTVDDASLCKFEIIASSVLDVFAESNSGRPNWKPALSRSSTSLQDSRPVALYIQKLQHHMATHLPAKEPVTFSKKHD